MPCGLDCVCEGMEGVGGGPARTPSEVCGWEEACVSTTWESSSMTMEVARGPLVLLQVQHHSTGFMHVSSMRVTCSRASSTHTAGSTWCSAQRSSTHNVHMSIFLGLCAQVCSILSRCPLEVWWAQHTGEQHASLGRGHSCQWDVMIVAWLSLPEGQQSPCFSCRQGIQWSDDTPHRLTDGLLWVDSGLATTPDAARTASSVMLVEKWSHNTCVRF